jgi:putative spermidine/putrescine transport system permease protein
VRHRFPGRDLLNTFFLSPLSLPWIITAIALLVFYSQVVRVETLIGLIIGHLIVSTPFVIRSVVSSLTGFDITLEEASANLGANELRTFFRITLPLLKTGIISGAIFAFLISFNNLNISLFISGVFIKPFPVVLYNFLYLRAFDPTVAALSSTIIITTIILGLLMNKYLIVHAAARSR